MCLAVGYANDLGELCHAHPTCRIRQALKFANCFEGVLGVALEIEIVLSILRVGKVKILSQTLPGEKSLFPTTADPALYNSKLSANRGPRLMFGY